MTTLKYGEKLSHRMTASQARRLVELLRHAAERLDEAYAIRPEGDCILESRIKHGLAHITRILVDIREDVSQLETNCASM